MTEEKSIEYIFSRADINEILKCFFDAEESSLFEQATLTGLRCISFDNKHIYVFTRGKHVSVDVCHVEEVLTKNYVNVYKIKRPDSTSREDYFSATAWYEDVCVEKTADALQVRVKNPKKIYTKKDEQILKTIYIPPPSVFNRITNDLYQYKADIFFHEIAHVEEMMLYHWPNRETVTPFPTNHSLQQFNKK